MCFSNLPIEFDENGDPSLAEEADDVERPGCGCEEVALEELDPEEAFHDIVASVPEGVRDHLDEAENPPEATQRMESD